VSVGKAVGNCGALVQTRPSGDVQTMPVMLVPVAGTSSPKATRPDGPGTIWSICARPNGAATVLGRGRQSRPSVEVQNRIGAIGLHPSAAPAHSESTFCAVPTARRPPGVGTRFASKPSGNGTRLRITPSSKPGTFSMGCHFVPSGENQTMAWPRLLLPARTNPPGKASAAEMPPASLGASFAFPFEARTGVQLRVGPVGSVGVGSGVVRGSGAGVVVLSADGVAVTAAAS
jgi:hypothetical protein